MCSMFIMLYLVKILLAKRTNYEFYHSIQTIHFLCLQQDKNLRGKITKDTLRYRSNVKVILKSRMYTTWSHSDTHMPNFGMPMSKSNIILPDSNKWWKYNFDIEVKDQCHKEIMNARDISYHDDTLTCQTKYKMSKENKKCFRNIYAPHGAKFRFIFSV